MELDLQAIQYAMELKGLSQADVAKKLDVSRESVSKWMRSEVVPRPARILKLARLLSLGFDEIYQKDYVAEPVIAFRKKAGARTKTEHTGRAADMGFMLRNLVPYLPFENITYPASFVEPRADFEFARRAAGTIRAQMQLHGDAVDFGDIISFFHGVNAILVPVMWGKRKQHENALHIYLPDSRTTWVYLNLDTKIMDFKFWMAHELAHVKAPLLADQEAEQFADMFAGELLFPVELAQESYTHLRRVESPAMLITNLQSIAAEFVISPLTVLSQLNRVAQIKGDQPWNVNIHGATTNFNNSFADVHQVVFGTDDTTAEQLIEQARTVFQTPFYDMLRRYLRASGKEASYVQRVLNVNVLDAKSIYHELVGHGSEDPA